MSADDERYLAHLRGHLGVALDDFTPSEPPTYAIKRAGRSIRIRRRVTVAIAAVVAVAVAAAAPGLAHVLRPTPIMHSHPPQHLKITARILTPHSPHRLIGEGDINGKPWRVTINRHVGDSYCVSAGSGDSAKSCGQITRPSQSSPVTIDGFTDGATILYYGVAGRRVSKLEVSISDGESLDLRPVRFAGRHWLAFELPSSVRMTRVAAYSPSGLLRTAVPFTPPSGLALVQDWQRPGQALPPESVRSIGSGVIAGQRWSVTVHAGPWGMCAVTRQPGAPAEGSGCWTGPNRGGLILSTGIGARPASWIAEVKPSVSYLTFTLANGGVLRVPAVTVGPERLYALVTGAGQRITSWGAYDATGHRLYGGIGTPKF